jgi:hypothetical protein
MAEEKRRDSRNIMGEMMIDCGGARHSTRHHQQQNKPWGTNCDSTLARRARRGRCSKSNDDRDHHQPRRLASWNRTMMMMMRWAVDVPA